MRLLLTALLIGFAMSLSAQSAGVTVPEIGIKIPLGETAEVAGVSITFQEVLEDSRCPKDITCVWEGRARVEVVVATSDKNSETKTLIFGATQGDESADLQLWSDTEMTLEGLRVLPYPETKSDSLQYVLLIKKKRS